MARTDEMLHGLIRDAFTYQRLVRKVQRSLALSPSARPDNEPAGLLREMEYQVHFRKALGAWLPQSIYRG
jgi:hypothetical protein